MTRLFRGLMRLVLRLVDLVYHWRHKSEAIGPMLLVNPIIHDGPDKQFADGTIIHHGDRIAAIHFDNRVTGNFTSRSSRAAALEFLRLLFESLEALAQRAANDPDYARYPVYQGITWFSPHGMKMGFETEPMADSHRRSYLMRFFRVLVWVVAPAKETRGRTQLEPTVFWMTRQQLLDRYLDYAGHRSAG